MPRTTARSACDPRHRSYTISNMMQEPDGRSSVTTQNHVFAPGKIVAIHLNFTSRADQRGRRPANPSYFFKPTSSVAATGDTIERPAGTELLAFEGEIALVIGTPARHVQIADAWIMSQGHRSQRFRALRPARQRQGLQRPLQGSRRLHPVGAQRDRRPNRRPRCAAPAHLGQRSTGAGRHLGEAAVSPAPSWWPTCRSTSPSKPAT